MDKKKTYQSLDLVIQEIEDEDVIVCSVPGGSSESFNPDVDPDGWTV